MTSKGLGMRLGRGVRMVPMLAFCAAMTARGAASRPGHWTATSTSAQAITGNVIFSVTKITFANAQSLALAKIGRRPDFKTLLGTVNATIYRVLTHADPMLEHGNHLCGYGARSRPATFIVIWKAKPLPGDIAPREMDAFSGPEPPQSEASPGFCGSFIYDRGSRKPD